MVFCDWKERILDRGGRGLICMVGCLTWVSERVISGCTSDCRHCVELRTGIR